MARPLTRARRRAAAAALVVAVGAVHLWLAGDVLDARIGAGDADTRPRRIEVAFVRELVPTAPPPAPPPRRRPPRPAPPPALAPAASAPEAVAETPLPEPAPEPVAEIPPEPPVAEATPPEMSASEAEPAQVAEAAAPPASAASAAATAFEWPPSTRLLYTLTGNYRGPVEGQAKVEWLRSGTHYQVHLQVEVGPYFAPLITRRLSSDGELGDFGLRPRRYDEETKVALRDPRRVTIFFDDDAVRLPGGRSRPLPPGVQDTASQFIQLTWLFTMQPELLQAGRSVDVELALAHDVSTWTYDVLARETLATPVGAVEAVHVKPRREPRPGIELTAEAWFAPSLQYLPVRVVIHQDADTYVDLLMAQLPQQAAQGAPR